MQAYYGTRFSPHLSITPEGFLICKDAVLCRTGKQKYTGRELGMGIDDVVTVLRPESEVFDPKFLASLEGKPVIDTHGSSFVDSDTAAWALRGHVQNVRRGPKLKSGDDCVIGDLIINDSTLIQKILNNQARGLSVGYGVKYLRNADGSWAQTKMRANHVAVVPNPRGGDEVRIYDASASTGLAEGVEMSRERDEDEIDEISGIETYGEPAADSDEGRALATLRKLRPFIERSGDRKTIDAYNNSIRALKGRGRSLLAADTRTPAQIVADAEFWTRLQNETDPDTEYGERLRSFHRRDLREGRKAFEESRRTHTDAPRRTRRASDASLMSDESYGDAIREAGRKMREKKY